MRALRELLGYHGFRVVKVTGTPGVNSRNTLFVSLDKLFSLGPALARRLVVLATKS